MNSGEKGKRFEDSDENFAYGFRVVCALGWSGMREWRRVRIHTQRNSVGTGMDSSVKVLSNGGFREQFSAIRYR